MAAITFPPTTDELLWASYQEVRTDYLAAQAELPKLPQRPRTERGMKAWAELAVSILYMEAEAASKRADYCLKLQAPGLAAGLVRQAESWRDLAEKLAKHL